MGLELDLRCARMIVGWAGVSLASGAGMKSWKWIVYLWAQERHPAFPFLWVVGSIRRLRRSDASPFFFFF